MGKRRGTSREVSTLVREAVEAIVQQVEPKPRLIILYGSEARGEATPESDIDLLLLLDHYDQAAVAAARHATYDVMRRHNFDRLISVRALSVADFEDQRRKGFGFAKNVEREGIVLWRAA